MASAILLPLKFQWVPGPPVWLECWAVKSEKLKYAHLLLEEQLHADHFDPSCSSWNTPIFCIPPQKMLKKMEGITGPPPSGECPQEPYNLGISNLASISQIYNLIVVDLKDCLFTIPLHEDDRNLPGLYFSYFQAFFHLWHVEHVTGIPHSPTGQAIVVQASGLLKVQLLR